jgi:hypothetical protein
VVGGGGIGGGVGETIGDLLGTLLKLNGLVSLINRFQ